MIERLSHIKSHMDWEAAVISLFFPNDQRQYDYSEMVIDEIDRLYRGMIFYFTFENERFQRSPVLVYIFAFYVTNNLSWLWIEDVQDQRHCLK